MENEKKLTAKEILKGVKLGNGSNITEYISRDGYIWKAIISAMNKHASQLKPVTVSDEEKVLPSDCKEDWENPDFCKNIGQCMKCIIGR